MKGWQMKINAYVMNALSLSCSVILLEFMRTEELIKNQADLDASVILLEFMRTGEPKKIEELMPLCERLK